MSPLARQPDARPVALDSHTDGSASYTLAPSDSFTLLAIAFQADLTAAAQADDIWVEIREPSGLLICGAAVGQAQPKLTVRAYTLADGLNPCDGLIVSNALALIPDTFARLPLVEGCGVLVEARKSTDGSADAAARISEGVLWVADSAAGTLPLAPVNYIPLALELQQAIGPVAGV